MTKEARIPDAEIDAAGYAGWDDLLRRHGIDPARKYERARAAHKGFRGVIVWQEST